MLDVGAETLIIKISKSTRSGRKLLVLKKAFQNQIVKLLREQSYQPTAKLSVAIYPFCSIGQAKLNTKRQKVCLVKFIISFYNKGNIPLI